MEIRFEICLNECLFSQTKSMVNEVQQTKIFTNVQVYHPKASCSMLSHCPVPNQQLIKFNINTNKRYEI